MAELPYTVCFNRKAAPAEKDALKHALGPACTPFVEIRRVTQDPPHEWKFYGTMRMLS